MVTEQDYIDLMTANDAAIALGITKRRVLQLIQIGRLPATKLGWSYLIRRSDLHLVAARQPGRPRKNQHFV